MNSEPDTSPTVVLVHGAFHDHRCFDGLAAALHERGIATVAPDRPGHGDSVEDRGDLLGDAAAVVACLDAIAGPKVLVGHSYGGAVVSQAGAGRDDVRHVVFVAALVTDAGESASEQVGAPPFEASDLVAAIQIDDTGTVTVDEDLAADVFYHDCDPATRDAMAPTLQPQAFATLQQHATAAAWHDLPSTYVVCTEDRAVPVPLQRFFASRTANVVEMHTGHFPFLSRPGDVADVIAAVMPVASP